MRSQLETLKRHQSWRRGGDTEMLQPDADNA